MTDSPGCPYCWHYCWSSRRTPGPLLGWRGRRSQFPPSAICLPRKLSGSQDGRLVDLEKINLIIEGPEVEIFNHFSIILICWTYTIVKIYIKICKFANIKIRIYKKKKHFLNVLGVGLKDLETIIYFFSDSSLIETNSLLDTLTLSDLRAYTGCYEVQKIKEWRLQSTILLMFRMIFTTWINIFLGNEPNT